MTNVGISSAGNSRSDEVFWREMMGADDHARRNQFVLEHLPLVRKTAKRLAARLPGSVDVDDLVQVGTLGLHRAMQAFDPGRRVRFTTFAVFHIRGAIFDHLRATDWVPRLVHRRARILEDAAKRLQQQLGRNPSEEELADSLQLSPRDFARMSQDARGVSQVSITETRSADDSGHPASTLDVYADPRAADPTREAQRNSLKDAITRGLSRAERLIVILYYYEQMSMKEIGRTLDLSESRICQMHSSIVARLKARVSGQQQELE